MRALQPQGGHPASKVLLQQPRIASILPLVYKRTSAADKVKAPPPPRGPMSLLASEQLSNFLSVQITTIRSVNPPTLGLVCLYHTQPPPPVSFHPLGLPLAQISYLPSDTCFTGEKFAHIPHVFPDPPIPCLGWSLALLCPFLLSGDILYL